jgi:formamidopyrimidine-DNA glycosylase
MKTSEPCPECGENLEFESEENSCCWFCPECSYERIEKE